MKEGKKKINKNQSRPEEEENDIFPTYPLYSPDEDIYNKYKEEDLDPDDQIDGSEERLGRRRDSDFDEDMPGGELDVPGSELDDELENIGDEDEENNYYSLGDDDHFDPDEDNSIDN